MSNIQITKQHENATTDKLNVNPLLIRQEFSLIFRWLKVVRSLPPLNDFEPSENGGSNDWCITRLSNPKILVLRVPHEVGVPKVVHSSSFFSCPSTGHSVPSVNLFDAVKSNQGPSDFCCSGETESTWPDH